jgi:predicted esterase
MLQFFVFIALVVAGLNSATVIKLSALNIEGAPTVSGLSSGGYMAVQMHVAHSATFNASSIFAAGPYFCAESSFSYAEEKCMYYLMGGPDTDKLISYTNDQAAKKTIDDPANMKDDKIFIYSGSKDTVVDPKVVHALETYYEAFVPSANIKSNFALASQHCIPTLNYGETCGQLKSPYIGDCAYDGAGTALQQMLGTLSPAKTAVAANLKEFDQTEFFSGVGKDICLDDTGFIYIPTACADGATACKLHVSFHGCSQEQASIGSDYANHAGFNTWAEANNIVVVYPYALANQALSNPNACWDWWGYTDPSKNEVTYTLQSGVQIAFAKAIVDTLMGVAKK